jgi:hypothetical protein
MDMDDVTMIPNVDAEHYLVDSFLISLIIGVIIATTLALLIGVILNIVIPYPHIAPTGDDNESLGLTLFLLYVQIIILVIIVAIAAFSFVKLFGRRISTYFALNIFVLILFLSQQQIFTRLAIVSRLVFGVKIGNH